MNEGAPIRTFARRAAIVALLYAFALSGLLTGLASALHAAPSPAFAELCRVDASGAPAQEPAGEPAPLDADCCMHACRMACAGAAAAPAARVGDVTVVGRADAAAPGAIAAARQVPPSPLHAPFGPRGPPSA